MNRRSFLTILLGAPIIARMEPAVPDVVSREVRSVEITEVYRHGRLAARLINGQPIPFHHQKQPFVRLNLR